ncbi:MAG: hypothetical protein ACLT76_03110 [Clostridium fessum]
MEVRVGLTADLGHASFLVILLLRLNFTCAGETSKFCQYFTLDFWCERCHSQDGEGLEGFCSHLFRQIDTTG